MTLSGWEIAFGACLVFPMVALGVMVCIGIYESLTSGNACPQSEQSDAEDLRRTVVALESRVSDLQRHYAVEREGYDELATRLEAVEKWHREFWEKPAPTSSWGPVSLSECTTIEEICSRATPAGVGEVTADNEWMQKVAEEAAERMRKSVERLRNSHI